MEKVRGSGCMDKPHHEAVSQGSAQTLPCEHSLPLEARSLFRTHWDRQVVWCEEAEMEPFLLQTHSIKTEKEEW